MRPIVVSSPEIKSVFSDVISEAWISCSRWRRSSTCVHALDRRVVLGDHERVQRGDLGGLDLVLALAQVVDRCGQGVGQLVLVRAAAVDGGELLAGLVDVALPAAQR